MQITRYTDYALRVLIYLAVHNDGLCTIFDIANSYGISKNHLMKIVQDLNVKGYLLAIRGKKGGIKLNRSPAEINIGKLIREVEDETRMVECFGNNNKCIITPVCQLKHIFRQALDSFYTKLEEYTLQDLVGPDHRSELAYILYIERV